ncbi:hypothetical protein C8R47DRAFT_215158 [Mycena vitilis]|nr:hypothetical protein C8R47DRAFT_215158 [Mycena vitilis]
MRTLLRLVARVLSAVARRSRARWVEVEAQRCRTSNAQRPLFGSTFGARLFVLFLSLALSFRGPSFSSYFVLPFHASPGMGRWHLKLCAGSAFDACVGLWCLEAYITLILCNSNRPCPLSLICEYQDTSCIIPSQSESRSCILIRRTFVRRLLRRPNPLA